MNKIIYGIHTVFTVLEREPSRLKQVYIAKGRTDKRLLPIVHKLKKLGISIQLTSRKWMDMKTKNLVHQGIIAHVTPGRQYQEHDLDIIISKVQLPFLLILDGITDPHNLGACLRSAEAAGINAVIVPKDKSAKLNSIAQKVACGATENMPLIRVTNLARILHKLHQHNIWVVGAADDANHTLYHSKLTGAIAVVMGSEDEGLRRLTRKYCDEIISIPMAGVVPSLNVSVATGVFLFEIVRQRYNY